MAANLKKWRQSASLILVAKSALSAASSFNYNVLTLKRSKNASVLPNATVFPGGLIEKADTSRDWLQLYKNFGLKPDLLDILNHTSNRPAILTNNDPNEIPRYLSLRIAAIRETFEESGILICKNIKHISNQPLSCANHISLEDIEMWRKKVHKNPLEFIELCSQMQIFPDLWSLYEWSNWVTPTAIPAKFNTIFFLASFQKTPPTFPDEQEIQSVQWKSPQEYLDIYREKRYFIIVPQFYEISRLNVFSDINKLLKFSSDRAKFGLEACMPVVFQTDSGTCFVLPGDDLYVDSNNSNGKEDQRTLKEVPNSNVQHRVHNTSTNGITIAIKNYSPKYNHVVPLNSKI